MAMEIELKCRERSRYKKLCASRSQTAAESELIIPDTMEDILRIVCCRHQCRIKEKSVTSDCVSVIGEICAAVLYVPEGGAGVRSAETVLPFEICFDAQGADSTCVCVTRIICVGVDAKAANPRKISLSASVTMEQSCYKYVDIRSYQMPESASDKLFFRESELKFTETVFAGEKNLGIEDDISLPDELSGGTLIKAFASLSDCGSEIVGTKLVVKGDCNIEALFTQNDELRTCSFKLPFSQLFTLPEEAPSPDVCITPMLTGQHYEAFDGKLSADIRAAVQIVCTQEQQEKYLSDAYSCRKKLSIEKSSVSVITSAAHECRETRLSLPYSSDHGVQSIVSAYAAAECPECSDGVVTAPVTAEVIYIDGEGELRSCRVRARAELEEVCGGVHVRSTSASAAFEGSTITVTVILSYTSCEHSCENIEMIVGITELDEDAEKPSANAYMCAPEGDLWELAKRHCSDTELIKKVNSIEDEIPDRLLLIPVI